MDCLQELFGRDRYYGDTQCVIELTVKLEQVVLIPESEDIPAFKGEG